MALVNSMLRPRNGRVLRVLVIVRISTPHQDLRSLDDQLALCKPWVTDQYSGEIDWVVVRGRGSGEVVDRADFLEAVRHVESCQFDVVLLEDIGRFARRVHATLFCEACEDADTRLIALNDHIDTARGDWRMHAFFASMKHEMSNADTSARIRRSLRHRFTQGGVFQFPLYGYIKPDGATTDADVTRDPGAEPVYDRWFALLEGGASYREVADWLNATGVPVGPFCRSGKWTGAMVQRITFNPILKGVRLRNRRTTRRVNKTGRRVSVRAPAGELLRRDCPHLAFIDPARYDRLIAALKARNGGMGRKPIDGRDPRLGVPKRRTVWPGQHLTCWACGRLLRYGGHGQKTHLLCAGAYGYQCWQAATVDGPLAARKLVAAIYAAVAELPEFDAAQRRLVEQEVEQLTRGKGDRLRDLARREEGNRTAIRNLCRLAATCPESEELAGQLQALEAEKADLAGERRRLEAVSDRTPPLPTAADLQRLAHEQLGTLAYADPAFGRVLRGWVPEIVVRPVRACDGGRVVVRAEFTLALGSLLPDSPVYAPLGGTLVRRLVVDLFDPPQQVAIREEVAEMTARGLTQREVAGALGVTLPAVQRAIALTRRMADLGVSDPYVPVVEPPADCPKFKRHRHPRFRFEPLASAPSRRGEG